MRPYPCRKKCRRPRLSLLWRNRSVKQAPEYNPSFAEGQNEATEPAQRKKVEARAAELIAEEMTLRELRHARELTQVKMAKTPGVHQGRVSPLEKRSGLLLPTLRKTVEAMGGNLSLVA